MKYLRWSREEEQEMFSFPDADVFRDKLPHDDVHRRDEQERKDGRRHMEDRAGDAVVRKEQDEQVRESVLTKPTNAQVGGGDSDLRHRQILAHIIDKDDRVLGRFYSLPGQFLQARPAHADDGELGADEHAVNEYQREGG
jgi:hypothetical protein